MYKLLGLDYNGHSIAWALFEDGTYAHNGTITSSDMKMLLTEYGTFLSSMNIDHVAIERIYIGPNAMSTKKLAAVHGAIVWESLRLNVRVTQLYVAHWKSKMLGTHRASKREALIKARELFNVPIDDHNLADSMLIGYCAVMERDPE